MDNRGLIALGFVMFGLASLWFGEVNLSLGQWTFLLAILIQWIRIGMRFCPAFDHHHGLLEERRNRQRERPL
jgi:hypothetical protein